MSKTKKCWIWFWYNEWTRIFFVMIPSYFIILIPILICLGLKEEDIRFVLCIAYIGVFFWGVVDNDFSNLRKIGMDENRRSLKKENKDAND